MNSWQKLCNRQRLFSWGTSASLICAGNTVQQPVRGPTRGDAPLDVLLTNGEGLVGDVEVRSFLGQSDHETVDFSFLGDVRRRDSKTATLGFQKADFELFRILMERVPWDLVLKSKGVQEG